MALLPRGVGARRVGVMVAQSGASRPGDAAGDAAAGRREAEGSRERAPPRALKAAGLRTRGRMCGARRPPAGAHPQSLGLGLWAAADPEAGGQRACGGGGRRAEPQGRQAERGGTDRGGQDGKRHPAGRPLLRQVGQRPRAPSREPRPRPPPPNNGDRAGGVAGRGGWGKLRDKGPRRGRGADSPPGGRVASRHGVGAGGAQACLRVGSRVKLLWSPPPKSDERLAK